MKETANEQSLALYCVKSALGITSFSNIVIKDGFKVSFLYVFKFVNKTLGSFKR